MIRDTFPEDPVTAVAVAMAESGDGRSFDVYAINTTDSHKGCKGSYGIFQIGCLHEGDPSILYNVEYNVKKARELYNERGWLPWGAYTDGRYKQYLSMR